MFGFSDLEDRILGTEGTGAVRQALADLAALKARAETEVGKGLAPADYEKAGKLLGAIRASTAILAVPLKGKE
jgi:hypothetical protein